MFNSLKTWLGGGTSSRTRRSSVRPRLELLEGRLVPSTLTVSNTLDYNPPTYGSLRAVVQQADADAQHDVSDTIQFASSLNGRTIYLNYPLSLGGDRGRSPSRAARRSPADTAPSTSTPVRST